MTTIQSHLPLEGLANARHLGGYPAEGGLTKERAYVRCENPGRVTAADRDALYRFGVRLVIDLRSPEEIDKEADLLAEDSRFQYLSLPVFSADASPAALAAETFDMGALYVHMLRDRGEVFQKILRAVLGTEGVVLFHCTAGKDRTGVLAALLLLAAGVDRETVVAEYAYTGELLRPLLDKLREGMPEGAGRERAEAMLAADPAYIETLIDDLDTHGGAKNYLRSLGFSAEEIDALNRRLIDKGENHEQNCA